MGDSYMSAQDGQGRSFMRVFGSQLEKKIGRPVEVTVFAEGDSTSASVRDALQNDPKVRTAVGMSDLIVISVGSNDVDPFGIFPQGTCAPRQALAACLKAYAPALVGNYEAIFTALGEVTNGRTTPVRVTSVDNPFIGMRDAPSATFGRDFFAQVAAAETDAICSVARGHGARCVDYLHVFGGPDGLDDPARFLAADHAHPGDLGIQTIGELLTRMGTAV
ncbi:SGNH/GDSL hydrolase family protein [Terrabacter sp. 2RAF25]|uniref:SGNH/GDSL hydrolase family protein n=1 Tax=Terrabacter sp. 2RAF25 TaxID=3232998 RepID=UPI003F96CF69